MAKNIEIPDGWEVKKLGEIGNFLKGKGIKKDELSNNGLPCIIYGQIYTSYEFYTDKFISFIPTNLKPYTTEIYKNDILFASSGETKEEIGKSIAYIGKEFAYAGGDIIILRQNKVISLFITYYLNSIGRNQLNRLGQGDSVVHIYKSALEDVKIPVPPLDEQKKIADILSLWDKAIQQTKDLIAYKETQKKGLMQNLLTGKKRLHGFNEKWKTTKLGEICNITTGKLDANAMDKNGIYPFFTCPKEVYIINTVAFVMVALLMSGNGANVGYIHYYIGKFNAYQRTYVLNNFKEYIIFLKYYLENYLHIRIDKEKKSGNTPYITLDTISKMNLLIPQTHMEQKAIADILLKADEEINLLNKQLDLYMEQKKGLMQNLLTGKIRV